MTRYVARTHRGARTPGARAAAGNWYDYARPAARRRGCTPSHVLPATAPRPPTQPHMQQAGGPGPLKALTLTKEHLAIHAAERQRIAAAGGFVSKDGRLNGRIQVRAARVWGGGRWRGTALLIPVVFFIVAWGADGHALYMFRSRPLGEGLGPRPGAPPRPLRMSCPMRLASRAFHPRTLRAGVAVVRRRAVQAQRRDSCAGHAGEPYRHGVQSRASCRPLAAACVDACCCTVGVLTGQPQALPVARLTRGYSVLTIPSCAGLRAGLHAYPQRPLPAAGLRRLLGGARLCGTQEGWGILGGRRRLSPGL